MNKKGVTLMELLIALGLIGVMGIFIGSIGTEMYVMKKEFLDKQQPLIQGHIASMTIFERVLRSGSIGVNAGYTISADGKQLDYKRGGTAEKIWLEGNVIKYSDGQTEKAILKDVKNLQFTQDFGHRLAVEIDLNSGETFRTCVQPRNEFTPSSCID
ncbi:MAG: prepilin-type N-terminal cleavage/methylation domain-containing protein [Candidatus Omnitrophica bacterium]|nr:prepilin-type N-terminal cleavage/methylation domain-containing protein [Candidatus Omnitrophota bacterium]